MVTVRRVYLYLVAAISLVTVTWSVIGLARLILSEGIGSGQITGLATMLAAIIVGLPIFLFHWLMAQRLAITSTEERESPVRQLYFYGVMAIGATPIWANLYRLAEKAFTRLLGGHLPQIGYPYDLTILEHIAAIVVWGVIWLYLWRQSQRHDQAGPTASINLGIRRLYRLGFALAGLVMVTWGSYGLMQTLLQSFSGILWQTLVAGYTAQLLIGSLLWLWHWHILQQAFYSDQATERHSILRKVYLYLAVFVFSLMALGSSTLLFKRLFELILGAPPDPEPLLTQLSGPLPLLILGVLFWAYHWSVLRRDVAQTAELPRQATVRRVYAYLVAGIGLVFVLSGLAGLLSVVIDILTGEAGVAFDVYRDQVALFVPMLLVSTPVWLLPWRTMQRQTTQPVDPVSAPVNVVLVEVRSLVRKIYLYSFVFIASLAIFGSVGWFVYHILTALLGADLPNDFLSLVLKAFVIGLLAAGVWLYHWSVLRRDGQVETVAESSRLADVSVVVIDGQEGRIGQTIMRQLQQDLPGIQLKPLGTTPQSVAAMNGQPFTASAVTAAQYIVGSWQSLSAANVATALSGEPALKFVIPTTEADWHWAGVTQRSIEDYARQITQGIKQSLKGEEITFERDTNITTIITIGVGVLIFLCIGSSLIGIVGSLF